MLSASDWRRIGRRLKLSGQQTLIVRLLFVDLLTAEAVAIRLKVTTAAVETQIQRIYAKLDISCRLELANRVYAEIFEIVTVRTST